MAGRERQGFTPVTEIDEQLGAGLERLFENAIRECERNGQPLAYCHLYKEALSLFSFGDEDRLRELDPFLFMSFNEKVIQDYLKEQLTKLGVSFYQEYLESLVEVEPGVPTTIYFRESLGFLLSQLSWTCQRIQSAEERPSFFRMGGGERGIVGLLIIDDQRLVLKTTVTPQETEITKNLGLKELAPVLHDESKEAFVEEFIPGSPIQKYRDDPVFVGSHFGMILRAVHGEGITYNDRFRDHLLVGSGPLGVRLIDFGCARFGVDFSSDWLRAREELEDSIYKNYPEEAKKSVAALML